MGKYAINAAEKPPFRGLKRPYSANNLLAVSSISITLKVYPEVHSQMRKHQLRMWLSRINERTAQMRKHQLRMWLSRLNERTAFIRQKPSASN